MKLTSTLFLGGMIVFCWYHLWEIQSACFVWKTTAQMGAHVFTTSQIVGEVWAAAYFAGGIVCWAAILVID